jgi:hypothetical protein
MNSTTPFLDFLTREAVSASPDFLLLGNAVKRWLLDDLEVQDASDKMMYLGRRYSKCRTVCDSMEFAGTFNRHLWPLDLSASALARRMVPIDVRDDGIIPPEIDLAAEVIAKRYAEAVRSLRQGMPLLLDMNNSPITPAVLCGPQLAIDLRTSHLWEIPSVENWVHSISENGNQCLKKYLCIDNQCLYIVLPNPDEQKPIAEAESNARSAWPQNRYARAHCAGNDFRSERRQDYNRPAYEDERPKALRAIQGS